MRTGGGAVQQQHQLAKDAAAAVRQAVSLAWRWGHAQVTPLHVASAVLPATVGFLKSHSHPPLQCSALELCLSVALDRLPKATATAAAPHARAPALSNALVSAFKRAHARQRRGSSAKDGRQRPDAVKVELEHLIVSMLDDPSVSRAMCEAGISSSHVRANVEKAAAASGSGQSNAASRNTASCRRRPKFTELTADNLKTLCTALEARVPWHKDSVPEIAIAVLQRRSGMARRRRTSSATWFIFQGRDSVGKKAMAQELARLVFGSYSAFASITRAESITSGCSSTGGDLSLRSKTSLDNDLGGYVLQRLYQAIRDDPRRVMMIDDSVEKLDRDSEIGIRNAIAEGRIRACSNGDAIGLEDTIIVLSCDRLGQREELIEKEAMMKSCFSFDLNTCAEDIGEEKEKSLLHGVEILDAVDGVCSLD